jgi:tetratricopeptide (TPR) repeat protein
VPLKDLIDDNRTGENRLGIAMQTVKTVAIHAALLIGFLLSAQHSILAQSGESALDQRADELFKSRHYPEAEALLKRSLAISEKAPSSQHPKLAETLNNLAELYRTQGRYAEAEPLYERALTIAEKALGPNNSDFATMLNNLALLYEDQGRYVDAEPLYKRSLAIRDDAAANPRLWAPFVVVGEPAKQHWV